MDAPLAAGPGSSAHPARRMLACLAVMAVLGSCAAPARHHAAVSPGRPARPGPAAVAARPPGISVPLGGEVDGLASGGGYLWAFERDSGVLARVDQRTGQVRRFPLAGWRGFPAVPAVTARGVWLAGPGLIKVDPQTGRIVARARLPRGVGESTDVTAAYGWLWVLVADHAFPPGWRVIRINPATGRPDGVSGDTPGTQLTGHTAAIQASGGNLWITESLNVVVRLDLRTLAMHTATTGQLSEGLVFGDGHAWQLDLGRPRLAEIDPRTGRVVRTLATPPPSATGNDYLAAGHGVLWLFRGSLVTRMDPRTGGVVASTRGYPIGPAFYPPAVITSTGLWYLAQTSTGIALAHLGRADGPQ